MTRLHCPFCGARELHEFAFRKTLPAEGRGAFERTYERVAELERSVEHWQHLGGCRAWLLVVRDPSTGAVREVQLLGGAAP